MIVQRGQDANARTDQKGHIVTPDAIMDSANGVWRKETPKGEGGRWRVDKIGKNSLGNAESQGINLTERLGSARLGFWVGVGEIEEISKCQRNDETGQSPEQGRRPEIRAQEKSKVWEPDGGLLAGDNLVGRNNGPA